MKPTRVVALAVLFALSTAAVESFSAPQQGPPVDPHSVRSSRVPKIGTSTFSSNGSTTTSLGTIASPANTSGTQLQVGPVVTPTTTPPELDETITVDPLNSNNLVAVTSDFSLGGYNVTKFAASYSNGSAGSWTEGFVPLVAGSPATGDSQIWQANSNPSVAIDLDGRVYICSDYLNVSDNKNGIYVSVGALGLSNLGLSAGSTLPVAVNLDPLTTVHEDKVWIAVDNSNTVTKGNVYVAWTRFFGGFSYIYFSRSTDHGQTWSAPMKINDPVNDGGVQGPQVAVGPKGGVYVTYTSYYANSARQISLVKSADGGQSFGTTSTPVSPFFNEDSFSSTYSKNAFASLAISPTNGTVFVVYSDQSGVTGSSEVELVVSRDRGTTFSDPVSITSPTAGEQFMPATATDSNGTVYISWFDSRNDPTYGTRFLDVYATSSVNNGNKFSSNTRVTPFSFDTGGTGYIGNYQGIAAGGGVAHPVWTSGGFNSGFLQTATLQ